MAEEVNLQGTSQVILIATEATEPSPSLADKSPRLRRLSRKVWSDVWPKRVHLKTDHLSQSA